MSIYLTANDGATLRSRENDSFFSFWDVLKVLSGTGTSRKWAELIRRSQKLLKDTIAEDQDAVTKAIVEVRNSEYAPTLSNDEQALR